MKMTAKFYVVQPGLRPPFFAVAKYLWGEVDFDSDGNSQHPDDTTWTELTITRCPSETGRVDIDPVSEAPLVLKVVSSSSALAERAARFLALHTSGSFASEWRSAERGVQADIPAS